jgi:branched-chain amino acid transport system substrate-binding protein
VIRNDRSADTRRRTSYLHVVTVIAAAALLVAACGSSSSKSTSSATTAASSAATSSGGTSGSSATSGATPTGTPLNVLTLASVNYNGPTYANILTTAKIAGEWINAHGGIQGHPVNVTTCDEQGDPNKTAQCGRQAIQNHSVAVIGSFTVNGASVIPELQAANTSWFGICCAASVDELTSPIVQQIGSGGGVSGLTVKAIEDGCKKPVLVIQDIGAADSLSETLVANASKSVNGPAIKTVLIPLTAQDLTPQVAQMTSGGTDCIIAYVTQSVFPSLMPAFVQSGATQHLYGPQGNLDITVTKPFPKPTNGAVVVGYYSDLSLPAWSDYRAALAQYKAPTNENYNSLGGLGTWAAYQGFVQVADSIKGPINNQTFLAAAQKATVNLTGEVAPSNFAVPFTALGPDYHNDTNRAVTYDVAQNGNLLPFDGGKFFDMTNAMLGQPLPAVDVPPAGRNPSSTSS